MRRDGIKFTSQRIRFVRLRLSPRILSSFFIHLHKNFYTTETNFLESFSILFIVLLPRLEFQISTPYLYYNFENKLKTLINIQTNPNDTRKKQVDNQTTKTVSKTTKTLSETMKTVDQTSKTENKTLNTLLSISKTE